MRLEQVGKNTIKCVLDKTDIMTHNIDIKNMAYGTESMKNLFQDILKEANLQFGFNAVSPLVVEAIPLEDELQLIISTVDSPDELDARFSKFSPFNGKPTKADILNILDNTFEQIEQKMKDRMTAMNGVNNKKESLENTKEIEENTNVKNTNIIKIFEFNTMDEISDACKNITSYDYQSMLYKDEKMKKFYLVVSIKSNVKKEKIEEFNKMCNVFAEYGQKVQGKDLSQAYYMEHYTTIIKSKAVEKLSEL